MYRLRILEGASTELGRLDTSVARRVVERIRWLGQNAEQVKHRQLTGRLAGFLKLRVGDYRVIYEVLDAERTLVIHAVGHRSEIYKLF